MSDIPFVAFGNDELGEEVHAGDWIVCPICGDFHKLTGGTDGETGEPSELILGYKCGEDSCLAAVGCKIVDGIKVAHKG